MSMPKRGCKLLAVLDRFLVKRKAHLEAVERALGGFHIEKIRVQHSATVYARRAPSSVHFDFKARNRSTRIDDSSFESYYWPKLT